MSNPLSIFPIKFYVCASYNLVIVNHEINKRNANLALLSTDCDVYVLHTADIQLRRPPFRLQNLLIFPALAGLIQH